MAEESYQLCLKSRNSSAVVSLLDVPPRAIPLERRLLGGDLAWGPHACTLPNTTLQNCRDAKTLGDSFFVLLSLKDF